MSSGARYGLFLFINTRLTKSKGTLLRKALIRRILQQEFTLWRFRVCVGWKWRR